jgi:hypothetical protein
MLLLNAAAAKQEIKYFHSCFGKLTKSVCELTSHENRKSINACAPTPNNQKRAHPSFDTRRWSKQEYFRLTESL